MTKRVIALGIAIGLLAQARTSEAAPPTPAAPFDWTAYYLSVNAGGAWRNRFEAPTNYSALGILGLSPGPSLSRKDGGAFGVGFGYNIQPNSSRFVFGIDYEFQWSAPANRPRYVPRYFTRATGVSTSSWMGRM